MAIVQHQAIRRDDNAGAYAARAATFIADLNPHDCGADGVGHGSHCVRVSVQNFGVGSGRRCRRAEVLDAGRRCKIKHGVFGVSFTGIDVGIGDRKWKMQRALLRLSQIELISSDFLKGDAVNFQIN
jgi:hypothetical protein